MKVDKKKHIEMVTPYQLFEPVIAAIRRGTLLHLESDFCLACSQEATSIVP